MARASECRVCHRDRSQSRSPERERERVAPINKSGLCPRSRQPFSPAPEQQKHKLHMLFIKLCDKNEGTLNCSLLSLLARLGVEVFDVLAIDGKSD